MPVNGGRNEDGSVSMFLHHHTYVGACSGQWHVLPKQADPLGVIDKVRTRKSMTVHREMSTSHIIHCEKMIRFFMSQVRIFTKYFQCQSKALTSMYLGL